ncbi:MAG: PAS domain S-box protein [Candidatus Rokubacteria bacterium]|nr:PAS domain S-box protein [Candidatus Rokubacteria bacterium]
METLAHLIENVGLLILAVLVYSYVGRRLPSYRPEVRLKRQLVLGALFGILTVLMMIERIQIAAGLYIDARWVPVALVGLFEGTPAGLLCAAIGAGYRAWQGGPGALPGIASLLVTGLAAGLANRWTGGAERVTWRHAMVLSAFVYLVVAAAYISVGSYGIRLFAQVWWSLLAAFVVGIWPVGRLLRDQIERERLLEERTRFRAILDEANDAIRIIDPDSLRILEANRKDSELTGLSREALIGRRVDELWPQDPATRAAHEAFVRETMKKGEATSDALPHVSRAGGRSYLGGAGRVVEYGGKRFGVFIFRDITDRLRAEEARREAEAMKAITELARATAHEINNPLTALIGNLELLRTDGSPEDENVKRATVAVEMGFRIRDIVARLMRITRREIDAGIPSMPMLDIRKSSDPEPRAPGEGA